MNRESNVIDWPSLVALAETAQVEMQSGIHIVTVESVKVEGRTWHLTMRTESGARVTDKIAVTTRLRSVRFFEVCAVFGLSKCFFGLSPSPEQVASALVNRRCRVGVSVRRIDGVTSVRRYLPLSSS